MLVCAFMQAFCAAPQRDSLQLVLDDSPPELGRPPNSLLLKHHPTTPKARTALHFHLHCSIQVPAGMAHSASHPSSGPQTLRLKQSGKRGVVPYRDSTLTKLFKNYFAGDGKVVMVVCASPGQPDAEETGPVLKFAARTREVMTTVSTPAKATTGLTAGRGAWGNIRSSVQRSQWRWWCWWLQQHRSALRQVGLILLFFSLCSCRWVPERPCRNRTQDDQACPQANGGH